MRHANLFLIALPLSDPRKTGAARRTPTGGRDQAEAAPTGEIRGAVLDAETGQRIRAASIAVHSAADSTLVAGTVTSADGSFLVEGLRPGRYTVRVVARGFEPVDRTGIAIAAGSSRIRWRSRGAR